YDPDAAKALLAQAGYPGGFEIGMDCPNDRYVNDEAICQAGAGMLARVGIRINLNVQPKAKYFGKVLATGGYDTSFYLLGWTPASLDSWNVITNLAGCRDEKGRGGQFNLGGYCNRTVEDLARKILVEVDIGRRDDMIAQAFRILHEEVSHIPLHQQALAWGVSKRIKVVQPATGAIWFYRFRERDPAQQ